MDNLIKAVYGLIFVLFVSIIIGQNVLQPSYETVEIRDLELTLDTVQPIYKIGQNVLFNAYLTNNHPYRVKVTLPDHLSYNQMPVDWQWGVAMALQPIIDRNQTVIINSESNYYLATISIPQMRVGSFKISVGCDKLVKTLIVNVTLTEYSVPDYIEGLDVLTPSNFEAVTYTGLPEGEDVRIYPESHVISDDSFRIVFENNRDEVLYWGSYWMAERYVDGEWVHMNSDWVWTLELRFADPYSTIVNRERFPFDEGLYRITKKCMLSDNYDRDKSEWVDEFTATFYLFKTQ